MYDSNEVTRLYLAGLTQREIGRIVGLSQPSVGDVLRRNGTPVRRRGPARRYSLDENFFDQVETPEQAYWLGFIAADGGIIRNHQDLDVGVGVALAVCDREHLRKLAQDVRSDAPIRIRDRRLADLRLYSRHMVAGLAKHGIAPRKTWTAEPWDAPEHLAPHYWRGMMDGDGHVSQSRDYISCCGTRAMMEAFQKFAHGVCGTKARLQPTSVIWAMNIQGSRQVRLMAEALYGIPGPVLDRKHAAAMNLIGRCPERIRRKCSVCGADAIARNLCTKHYQRLIHNGDPSITRSGRDNLGRFNGSAGSLRSPG